MKLMRELVPRPKGTGSISSSALFRSVDARKCTLLVDEADYAFRADANPDLLAIFNSGNERTFAVVTRSVPLGEGQFEDHDFHTFGAMCFTSINKLSTKSMQSRCISLPMKPATKEEAAKLELFRASRCPELKGCNRKFMRWAADLPTLPEVEISRDLFNRGADNWRCLLQIAELAGGTWPARVLSAATADTDGEDEEGIERGADGLLDAIWRVFAAQVTDSRRMHTADLIRELEGLDEGRWLEANKGKAMNGYYFRSKLKPYVRIDAKGLDGETRPRQWRSAEKTPVMRWGYHELHFEDAFLRYLGKELPSKSTEPKKASPPKPSLSPGVAPRSASPASGEAFVDKSKTYVDADTISDADSVSAAPAPPHTDADGPSASAPASASGQAIDKSGEKASDMDDADQGGVSGEKERMGENNVTRYPHGPRGRKARKGASVNTTASPDTT